MEDPAGCEAGITTSWSEIATAMYPVFLEGNSVCGTLGLCTAREWTCDECVGGLGQIGGIISDPTTIADVVAFLQVRFGFRPVVFILIIVVHPSCVQGPDFCGNHADQASCPEVKATSYIATRPNPTQPDLTQLCLTQPDLS